MQSIFKIALSLLLFFSLTACSVVQPPSSTASKVTANAISEITPGALMTKISHSAPILILDVRSAQEYAAGHIPGAINIEHRQVASQLGQLRPFIARQVVVYCERGVRAGRAEAVLIKAGFTHVSPLRGDMPAWRAAGFPIEGDNSD